MCIRGAGADVASTVTAPVTHHVQQAELLMLHMRLLPRWAQTMRPDCGIHFHVVCSKSASCVFAAITKCVPTPAADHILVCVNLECPALQHSFVPDSSADDQNKSLQSAFLKPHCCAAAHSMYGAINISCGHTSSQP
jgi:hypothetical protein